MEVIYSPSNADMLILQVSELFPMISMVELVQVYPAQSESRTSYSSSSYSLSMTQRNSYRTLNSCCVCEMTFRGNVNNGAEFGELQFISNKWHSDWPTSSVKVKDMLSGCVQ